MNLALKELRENKGWSKNWLSKKTGINRATYTHIEVNDVTPTLETAIKIAEGFGIKDVATLKQIFLSDNVQPVNCQEVSK